MATEASRYTLTELRALGLKSGDWLIPKQSTAFRVTVLENEMVQLDDDWAKSYPCWASDEDPEMLFRWVRVTDVDDPSA